MSQFIEDLLRPHVVDTSLDDGYPGRWLPTRRAKPMPWSGATPLPETWLMQRGEV